MDWALISKCKPNQLKLPFFLCNMLYNSILIEFWIKYPGLEVFENIPNDPILNQSRLEIPDDPNEHLGPWPRHIHAEILPGIIEKIYNPDSVKQIIQKHHIKGLEMVINLPSCISQLASSTKLVVFQHPILSQHLATRVQM